VTSIAIPRSTDNSPAQRQPHEPVRPGWLGPLSVSLAAVGFGLNPYFATRAFAHGVEPVAAASIRVLVMLVILAPYAPRLRGWGREGILVAGAGAISMLGFAGYFMALKSAPVAAATVVYYTYPIVVLVLSALIWRRRLQRWEIAVCALVLIGVAVAVGPIGTSPSLLIDLAPAVAAPIGWAVYLLVLAGPAAAMPTMPKIFAGACGGVLVLLPIAAWHTRGRLLPLHSEAVVAMGLLTLCTLAIPAVLVTWGAAHVGERATAMIGSFEFVVAVGAGWLLLGDQLSLIQTCGVVLVIAAALYAASRTRSRHTVHTEPTLVNEHVRAI
jgi:drug/metabolite transporter (DMT)-like permease